MHNYAQKLILEDKYNIILLYYTFIQSFDKLTNFNGGNFDIFDGFLPVKLQPVKFSLNVK